MKDQISIILKFLGLLVLIIIVSLIPELIGGDLTDALKKRLGEEYYPYWIAGIGVITLALYTLWSEGDKFFKKSKDQTAYPQQASDKSFQKIRTELLESYQGRLRSKLAARYPINLELKYSLEGTTTKAPLYDNKTIRSTKIKKDLVSLFDKHRGRLLIVGAPGSGKTTLLLQLAEKLLEREEEQIPIIVNLATWRTRFSSFEHWFLELLPQMGFSKTMAKQLIVERRLLPLFDGLDELSEKDRPACLTAIGEYGKDQSIRYAICSRLEEYTQTRDAPVYCQILIKPLTLVQIRAGLKEVASPETNGMLHAIKQDKLLAEAIKTPFYLNTVQLLFASSKVWNEFDFEGFDLELRKHEIVERFIENSSSNLAATKYTADKVTRWLGFLADRMDRNQLITFEMVDLQYNWTRLDVRQVFIATYLQNLSVALFLGLVIGLFGGLEAGLLVGLVGGFLEVDLSFISTRDRVPWSLSLFYQSFKRYLAAGLIAGLLGGLIVSVREETAFNWTFGLFFGLTPVLIFSMLDQFENNRPFIKVSYPYQRFYGSMKNFYFSILQNIHLQRILYRKGLLPRKLVHFLQEATIHNILESDGGTWRFRHRILQDYFASHWQEVNAEEYDS